MGGCESGIPQNEFRQNRTGKIPLQMSPESETPSKNGRENMFAEQSQVDIGVPLTSHANLITAILQKARVCREAGNFKEQLEYLDLVIKMFEQHKLPKNMDYIGLLNNLGVVYGKIGKHEKASEVFVEALDIYYTQMGLEFNQIMTILQTNLAINTSQIQRRRKNSLDTVISNRSSGQYGSKVVQKQQKDASQTFNQILKLSKEINGQNHHITGKIYQAIGNNYLTKGNYQFAFDAFMKAHKVKTNIFGDVHAELVLVKMSLAQCNFRLKRYSVGLESYKAIFIMLFQLDDQMRKQRKIVITKMKEDLRQMVQKNVKSPQIVHQAISLIIKNNLEEQADWKELYEKLQEQEEQLKVYI